MDTARPPLGSSGIPGFHSGPRSVHSGIRRGRSPPEAEEEAAFYGSRAVRLLDFQGSVSGVIVNGQLRRENVAVRLEAALAVREPS